MEDLKTLKACGEILISHESQNEDSFLFSHQTSSMKHHLTETHEHNFEIHNAVFSVLLTKYFKVIKGKKKKNYFILLDLTVDINMGEPCSQRHSTSAILDFH